jgi:hypothetical protein
MNDSLKLKTFRHDFTVSYLWLKTAIVAVLPGLR